MACFSGPEIVNNGLQIHLDAANLKSYPGSGTTWTDLSNNGRNATLNGTVTFSSTNGGSLNMNATSDYITFSTITTSPPMTFSFFYKTSTISATLSSILNQSGDANFDMWRSGSSLYVYTTNTDASRTSITWTSALVVEQWYHVTGVFSASGRFLYLNGVLVASDAKVSNSVTTSGISTNGYNLDGDFANFMIYNIALSAAEVLQNFEAMRGRYGI